MSPKKIRFAIVLALASGLFAGTVQAYEAGDIILRFGPYSIFPKSDNLDVAPGTTLDVENAYSLGVNFTYMATRHIGLYVLGAIPFKHDIKLSGAGEVASTWHLPPTFTVQYHFMPEGKFRPYVGAGFNYTWFFNEKTKGVLTGTTLHLDNSFGLAGQVGADFDITPDWFINVDVLYIDIDTKAKLGSGNLGTVKIDPWVFGLNLGTRF